MNRRIKELKKYILDKKHHSFRQELEINLCEKFEIENLSAMQRSTEKIVTLLNLEKPVILPDEKITFTRTLKKIPGIFTVAELDNIKKEHYIHYSVDISNICYDYETTILYGLESRRKEALETRNICKISQDIEGMEFIDSVIKIIDSIENFCDRYKEEARRGNKKEILSALNNIPRNGAANFYESLLYLRLLNFVLYLSGNYHNTIGRFDQFMYPFLKKSLEDSSIAEDDAFDLLLEFFISLNKDTDLYPGIQRGDNGQTIVLGGCDKTGKDSSNILTSMCLEACLELKMIDPKINLRVNKNTGLDYFNLGSRLTKIGLGFPQYCNDDIFIKGLVEKGYDLEDARDYAVAACWEIIIPGYGMEIVNLDALSFPEVVDSAIHKSLIVSDTFDDFFSSVEVELKIEIDSIINKTRNLYIMPSPLQSIFMKDCLKRGKDISSGSKYNNYGIHGAGISTAADSLAAVKKYVFEEKFLSKEKIIDILDSNYEGYEDILTKFKDDAPKMGNDDDYVDSLAMRLLDIWDINLSGKRNDRGGIFRPGSATAMYYLWLAEGLNATPDGRKKGEPLPANFSPSLNSKIKGPVSMIKSFSKPDMTRIINGGPLTIELHSTVFNNSDGVEKVAMLVKSFIKYGGHQIQLNTLNREILLEAQRNPERYKNLIVRVWGWSGYFVELEKEYQDHIISRTEYAF
jgi:formate C-acetyltransferase